jgi:16S rRNA (adenine1518-N6/adenine1519-N6)-dimethyltransferase
MAQTVTEIKALLAEVGMHPRRRFGQNFLVDAAKLQRIVHAADLSRGQVVLEVGPGTGVLTEALLAAEARVVVVEIDRDLAALLRRRLGPDSERFILLNADALAGKHELNPQVVDALRRFGGGPFMLVANLPYNIASPLLANLAADHPTMKGAVVMVQKEVAQRLTARPGGKDYGPISVLLQALCDLSIVDTLPPACFWPQPKVDSAVVKIIRRAAPLTDDPVSLSAIVHRLFSQRRKQIGAVLGRDRRLPTGFDPAARPERLTVEQFVTLSKVIRRFDGQEPLPRDFDERPSS